MTTAHCITTCKRTGSPACASTPAPGACAAFTSTCTAVAMTPVQTTNAFSDQQSMAFNAHTAPPGPAGCCVIDGCAGVTRSDATGGNVSVDYLEIVYLRNGAPYNGTITTKVGVSCPIGIPTDVYSRSDIYRVNFTPDLPFSLPPGPPAWSAPYVVSAGDLSLSIDSADVPHPTDVQNSFTPSTWRLVGQTLGIDKVCAEQQLMQGHATASFIKNDGTPCTVTIYAQGTRAVAPQ